jgi:GNAT superfamily N-acetyltransferase
MSSGARPLQFFIRAPSREELRVLQDVEVEATQRFDELPELGEVPGDITPIEELEEAWEAGHVWIPEVDGEIAGYACGVPLDGFFHLEEISVLQKYGQRGLGRALVEFVIEEARRAGMRGVTLTTFRDVAWNAPFYARIGFRVLEPDDVGPGLLEAIDDEARRGLPAHLRVAMVYEFS